MTISLENIKTLIIEDAPSSGGYAGRIAEALCLKMPLFAASFEEAAERLSSEKIGLVISDYSISNRSIFGLVEKFPSVPVIILFEDENELRLYHPPVATLFGVLKDSQNNYMRVLPEAARMLFVACEKEKQAQSLKEALSKTSRQVEVLTTSLEQYHSEKQNLEKINIEISQAIEKAQSLAMEAELENMAKSDFLVKMSEKIKIPMNSIIGYADLLVETSCDHNHSSFAKEVKTGAERLLSELNSVVDFCKLEAGQVNIKEMVFDMEILVDELISRTVDLVKEKNIDVFCSIAPELPALLVGDPQRIRHVIMNLLENAAVFTNEGRIELSLDVVEETENRVKINVIVRDTGIGIKKKNLPKIFQAFKSADDAVTKKYTGLVVGLSSCQKIVHLLGGEIHVESKFKEGSVFNFHTWFKKHDKQERFDFRDISLAGRKVLIVENNMHTLEVLKQMVVSFDMAVTALQNGREALVLIEAASRQEEPFEICIIDLELSDKDPYEIAAGAKKPDNLHPFLLALSTAVTEVATACCDAGFDGFLPKPLNRKSLYYMLKALVYARSQGRKKDFITQYSVKENMKHAISVLAVCPDTEQADRLKVMLDNSGYLNKIIGSAAGVHDTLKENPGRFDIILLDNRSREDETLLREAESLNIPVVIFVDPQPKTFPAVSGKRCFVTKPVTRHLIYQKIKALVIEKNKM